MEPFNSGFYAFYEDELHTDLLSKYVSLPQFLKEHGYERFGAGKIQHGFKIAPQEESDYMIRDREFRYTRYFDGGEELYSHTDDPDEWTNLANNIESVSVKKRLAGFLPKQEGPLVLKGITAVRAKMSADEPKPNSNARSN